MLSDRRAIFGYSIVWDRHSREKSRFAGMEDQTTIKLKIPHQDLTTGSLFQPNTHAARSWVESLPVTDTNSTVQMLDQALNDLNRIKTSPEVRYDIMEILRPNLEVALTNLSRRYLNQPLVLPKEPQKMAEFSDRLFTLASTAYTIVAIEAIQQRDSIREVNPARLTCQAIQRALLFAGRKVLQTLQLHRPMEIQGWHTLHQLYALGEHQRLANLPVPEPLTGGSTITATYLQATMLGCCKPNQLRQRDLAAVYRGLQQWSELVPLGSVDSDEALFVADLDSDQPPIYSSLYKEQLGAQCRFIDTTSLIVRLTALKEEAGGAAIKLDKNTSLSANILDQLIAALGSISLRNFKRSAVSSPLWICVGLSSTHFHVAGEQRFEQLLYGNEYLAHAGGVVSDNPFLRPQIKADAWQMANPGQDYTSDNEVDPLREIDIDDVTLARVLAEEDRELPPNERYPVFKTQLADASSGGYCLEWHDDLTSDIKVGDIVGLKEEENKDWVIAVIRWLSRLDNAKTLTGLELLSPRAIPYGARIHVKPGEKSPPRRVLLLPEIALVGQPQTLVTPNAGFKERQKVTIGSSKEAHSVQLLRQIASTGSFAQFEFRYIQELGDVLAESQNESGGGAFDSLWSNI